jgi:hypothetical protein
MNEYLAGMLCMTIGFAMGVKFQQWLIAVAMGEKK